ncbi:DUF3040 domain-containing protein [Actinokineospora sp. PR83]|uniref:DUF3040 domain-containing protein n=1 Tax=Actinokineospora sp. PR83 TaxID=2884908 RepID=UPI001F2BE6EF|nr:DUF3040 domain-containing protein [Actinokineospora sp. PR83]MCG8915098.1 DUF3040 domain-containing protein [Actinokineospora sp. PR83]
MDPSRLTWHEQRVLSEIERRLDQEDPDMVSAFRAEPVDGTVPGPGRLSLAGIAVLAAVVGLLVSAPLVVFCGMIAAVAVLLVDAPKPGPGPEVREGGLPGALPPV